MQHAARSATGASVEAKLLVRLGDAVALTRGGPGSGSEDKRYIYSYR